MTREQSGSDDALAKGTVMEEKEKRGRMKGSRRRDERNVERGRAGGCTYIGLAGRVCRWRLAVGGR